MYVLVMIPSSPYRETLLSHSNWSPKKWKEETHLRGWMKTGLKFQTALSKVWPGTRVSVKVLFGHKHPLLHYLFFQWTLFGISHKPVLENGCCWTSIRALKAFFLDIVENNTVIWIIAWELFWKMQLKIKISKYWHLNVEVYIEPEKD